MVEELHLQIQSMDGTKGWFERRLKDAEVGDGLGEESVAAPAPSLLCCASLLCKQVPHSFANWYPLEGPGWLVHPAVF